MRIALVGYGKMGRAIEALAPTHGVEVAMRVRQSDGEALRDRDWTGIDAAIEFTSPEAAVENLLTLASLGVKVVCGTTGWLGQLDEVKQQFARQQGTLVYGANFSIGVNLFERIVRQTAQALQDHPAYGAYAWEAHHAAKKDRPSGTLLQLVAAMRESGYTAPVDVSSSRAGSHPGTHEICFDSAVDSITLRHTARSRDGFAAGALWAAQQTQTLEGRSRFLLASV